MAQRRAAKRIVASEMRRLEGQVFTYLQHNPTKASALVAAQKAADETAAFLRSISDEIGSAAMDECPRISEASFRCEMESKGKKVAPSPWAPTTVDVR